MLERLSFRHRACAYAALWLSAGIVLAPFHWIVPAFSSLRTLLLCSASRCCASHKRFVSHCCRSPAHGCCSDCCSAKSSPLPNPQTQLSSIADNGGATAVEGEIDRTTPVRLTQSTLPFGNDARGRGTERESRSPRSLPPMAGRLPAVCARPFTARRASHSPQSTAETRSAP